MAIGVGNVLVFVADAPGTIAPAKDATIPSPFKLFMATNPAAPVPNPVQHRDANVLIGILAILEGVIWGGQLDEWVTSKIAERFVQAGLLAADHGQYDLRQAISDMNQRIRYAAGEYDTPPSSVPLRP